jgi:hypothetical protein
MIHMQNAVTWQEVLCKYRLEFTSTVVPPYPLIQYPRFKLSAVYRGL